LDVGGRKDEVFSVTFITGRSIRRSALQCPTVYSRVKFLISHIMADPAVHFLEPFGMRKLFNVCIDMARNAVQVLVDRLCKFLEIHIQRDGPALPSGGQVRIFMTYCTVFIRLGSEK
jgi:hypothetical protein